ncbi:cation channel family protein [Tritrichomonas foetus]|uniref:Cation channel family protein n=1 Tax=Tritrichomonas foetus TaxID=1144522 RepID=A0A1J4KTS3_9EUKA|nr:cation channel family protein [Tritrichomonas foetus]|eukprot:OHT13164.1 cation channel family protein [Tritrichomonas foetus]
MPPRRLSAPSLNQMSMITALQGNAVSPQSLETTAVFPEFTPSSSYDKVKLSNWSHFRAPRRFWEYLIFAVSIVTPIEISYVLIFDRQISVQKYSIFFIFDAIQLIDNFVILKTPFLRHGILVDGIIDIIRNYGVASFIIHAIASLPLGWIGIIKEDIFLYGILSINRLFRLHQCWRSNRFIQDSQAYQGAISKIFPHLLFFILVVHIYACIFYLIAHIQGINTSWLQEYVQLGFTTDQLYVVCLYFVLTTIFTIGFGDLHPSTSAERIICIFLEVTGVAYEDLIVARMVQLLLDPNRSLFIKSAQTMSEYLHNKKIDKIYQKHVTHYMQNVWDSTHGAPPWSELFKGLPTSIKSSITLEFCDKAFSKMPLFYGMRQNFFLKFIETMRAFTYIPGQIIYEEGDHDYDLYVFKGGIVQFIKSGQAYVTQETGNNFVDGEKEFLFKEARKTSLVALTFVDGWKASRGRFCEVINSDSRWRKLLFINTRHLYPDVIVAKGLDENNMWEEDEHEIKKHIKDQPIFLSDDEDLAYIGAGSSDSD